MNSRVLKIFSLSLGHILRPKHFFSSRRSSLHKSVPASHEQSLRGKFPGSGASLVTRNIAHFPASSCGPSCADSWTCGFCGCTSFVSASKYTLAQWASTQLPLCMVSMSALNMAVHFHVVLFFNQEDSELTPVVLSVLLMGGGILLTFDMHHPGRSWCLRKLRSRVGSWSCNRNK